jgi:uncharacterized protein YukE
VRRNWFIWAIVIGVASIALAALVMRLTADDGNPSANEWADAVCTDFATWKSSIEALTDVSPGDLNAEALGEKIDEAETATSTLVSELQSSVDALKQGAEEASQASSPQDFLEALAALAPQFQALLDSLSTTIEDLQNANVSEDAKAELQAAFDDAESCQQLQGDG